MQVMASANPYRSPLMNWINRLGPFYARLGGQALSLEIEHLQALAIRATGHENFGDAGYEEGLQRLLTALKNEARLTPLGRLLAHAEILGRLKNRLQLVHWRDQHPEIAQEDVRAPLIILGLPRTGTTLLHALLALDPANRAPLFWELEHSVPPATPASWTRDARIARVEKNLARFNRFCPGIQAVHLMEARLQQECVAIFAMDLRSEQFYMMYDIPSYAHWLKDESKTWALQFHRQVLQHLQSGGVRGERWLLKSPGHLHLIEALLAVYPQANFIHTHRDPLKVCTSLASMATLLRGVASDHLDLPRIGRQQLDLWSELLDRAVDQRQHLSATGQDAQFFDVAFSQLQSDPLQVVERLYAHFGYPLTASVKGAMRAFLTAYPRDKHGLHRHEAADFGIDPLGDKAAFTRYRARFDAYLN